LWQRIQSRLSGRSDDNEESFKKRIQVYHTATEEVLKQFDHQKKLIKINSELPLLTVFENILSAIKTIN
jgi:adenylate kinase